MFPTGEKGCRRVAVEETLASKNTMKLVRKGVTYMVLNAPYFTFTATVDLTLSG